ncbi:hypothetical protein BaRGS_00000002, partial [Batillaria attramentaria]
ISFANIHVPVACQKKKEPKSASYITHHASQIFETAATELYVTAAIPSDFLCILCVFRGLAGRTTVHPTCHAWLSTACSGTCTVADTTTPLHYMPLAWPRDRHIMCPDGNVNGGAKHGAPFLACHHCQALERLLTNELTLFCSPNNLILSLKTVVGPQIGANQSRLVARSTRGKERKGNRPSS